MEEFTSGNYRAVLKAEPAIEGGPTKIFSVEWFRGNQLLQSSSGYEDYKLARQEAKMLLAYHAREER